MQPQLGPRQSSVAVLCFLPDTGHITQLLHLAKRVADATRAHVRCFLPLRFAQLVCDFGFEFHALAALDRMPDPALFAELSARPIFFNAFSDDLDLRDRYWAALHAAASGEMESLGRALMRSSPEVILADNHVFAAHYRHIAAACGARLVLNRGSGTLVSRRRPFVRAYGLSGLPNGLQRSIELAGWLAMRLRGRWRRLRHPARVRATEECEGLLHRRMGEVFGACDTDHLAVTTVCAGLCVLERELFPEMESGARQSEVLLAPRLGAPGPLPADLREWLERQPRGRVVYLSFGSMVWPDMRVVRCLLQGLRDLEVSVLWAQPEHQRTWLDTRRYGESFRFEGFAPQRALLMSGLIDCFVTHAGSGGIQEALTGGVPMFCLPFFWDQPYSASLVVRAGAGIRCFPRTLTRRRVSQGVRELLDNPAYAACARAIDRRLRALSEAPSQTAWIPALFGEAAAARDSGKAEHREQSSGAAPGVVQQLNFPPAL